jgi:phosphopantetheinyl transferase
VGIDVAQAEEFSDGYPFSRVFYEEDLTVTLKKTHDDVQEAAALLWSAKEAIVKAIGCGFHLLDPIDVRVVPLFDEGSEYILRGQVRSRSLGPLPVPMYLDVPVSAVREENTWICTALLDLGHKCEIEPDLVI